MRENGHPTPICESAAALLEELRSRRPLVHNITNYVVMNFTANALLCVGASPVMAHAEEEVEEMVGLAQALVINIGTLSAPWVRSMLKAGKTASALGLPIVLDPVGAGATSMRTEVSMSLLGEVGPAVVRGNASEIMALAGASGADTKGVDSTRSVEDAASAAAGLARKWKTVVAVTGRVDLVTDGSGESLSVHNGHPLMGRITGSGCAASAITGAFLAAGGADDPLVAAASALIAYGIAGEIGSENCSGPGSFRPALLDALSLVSPDSVRDRCRAESSG